MIDEFSEENDCDMEKESLTSMCVYSLSKMMVLSLSTVAKEVLVTCSAGEKGLVW